MAGNEAASWARGSEAGAADASEERGVGLRVRAGPSPGAPDTGVGVRVDAQPVPGRDGTRRGSGLEPETPAGAAGEAMAEEAASAGGARLLVDARPGASGAAEEGLDPDLRVETLRESRVPK